MYVVRTGCAYLSRKQREVIKILQVKTHTLSPGVLNTRKRC
jgi:hypothetical protein